MEGSQVEMLEVMSLWRKHKGGEVGWMPLLHLNIAHHSSEDFLKTLSTCCLGTGKKRKITVHTWEETHTHTNTQEDSSWAGDKTQVLHWWWATFRDTAAAHTHTLLCTSAHTFKVRYLLQPRQSLLLPNSLCPRGWLSCRLISDCTVEASNH